MSETHHSYEAQAAARQIYSQLFKDASVGPQSAHRQDQVAEIIDSYLQPEFNNVEHLQALLREYGGKRCTHVCESSESCGCPGSGNAHWCVLPEDHDGAHIHACQIAFPRDAVALNKVLEMAFAMQIKLHDNQHKGNREVWLNMDPIELVDKLVQEVIELRQAVQSGADHHVVLLESADVANFAMMVADNVKANRSGES